jgi:hypothetical protein
MAVTSPVVHSDPAILGGTSVFVGTRVPVRALLDYLEAGDSLSLVGLTENDLPPTFYLIGSATVAGVVRLLLQPRHGQQLG